VQEFNERYYKQTKKVGYFKKKYVFLLAVTFACGTASTAINNLFIFVQQLEEELEIK